MKLRKQLKKLRKTKKYRFAIENKGISEDGVFIHHEIKGRTLKNLLKSGSLWSLEKILVIKKGK